MIMSEVKTNRKNNKQFMISMVKLLFETYNLSEIFRCPSCKKIQIGTTVTEEIICGSCDKIVYRIVEKLK